ncbi:hypothetical protein QNH46_08025 [Paenibacillus woosongensis]|uniref:Spore coat protein n=1 Tax=Paenibacillus woosongensis TaxID=307580 RepID=A0AA95ICF8_9BACL|nr:hypothetical protein [Paenibacillus woosongensis]WHX50582.1 hypothetical protein QNH46_08025 [Paenibacillus woosongensis]
MNASQMQPLTAKELEYISDSVSNEEMLLKLTAAALAVSQNPNIQNVIQSQLGTHEQHINQLIQAIQQHQALAPTQAH